MTSEHFNSKGSIIAECLTILSQITSRIVYFLIEPNETILNESDRSKELFYVINDYMISSKVLDEIFSIGIMYENKYNYETNMWILAHYLLGLEKSQNILEYILSLFPKIIRKEKEFLDSSEIPHHILGILYFMELCANFFSNNSIKYDEELILQIPFTLIQIIKVK